MEFSKNTKDLMETFMRDFESKYLHIKDDSERAKFDRIAKKLYTDITKAEDYYENLVKQKNITKKKTLWSSFDKDIENGSTNVPITDLLKSSYVPPTIFKIIQEDSLAMIKYNVKMDKNEVIIRFLLFDENDLSNVAKYDNRLKLIIMWLHIAFSYCKRPYGKTINLYMYLTPELKMIPDNKLEILNINNCNSAVTTACEIKGDVLIFREEEWFKVFIHETFHLLCLDFASMPTYVQNEFNEKIQMLIPIKSEYNIYEAYTEFWATIFNCAFCSYNIIDEKTFDNFASYIDFCIQSEIIFSIFQMNKILHFMGLTYEQLYIKNDESHIIARKYLYREKTNVFAYYIFKTVLLFFHSDFMEWCERHNGASLIKFRQTLLNLMEFASFFKEYYKNKDFIQNIKSLNEVFLKMNNQQKKLLKTMRMTSCELKV